MVSSTRSILAVLLLAGCSQPSDDAQLNRIESSLNRIETSQTLAHQLPAPMSEEQYRQIPVNTLFLAPDGTVRRKAAKP